MTDQLATMRLERSEGPLVICLSGEIDLSNADQVHRDLETTIQGCPRVILDLTELEYVDSQGLRLIRQICTKARRDGIELTLVAPPGSASRQVLDMARMDDYVEICSVLEG
jgi:anti-anti-sigma factor